MSLWTRIGEALAALTAGEGLSAALERLAAPPERSVAFTIACIALGAKMAKADGRVTRDEVAAFRAVFQLREGSELSAGRVFDLARQDVAGFEIYAAQAARLFGEGSETLRDLLEALFVIAAADGVYHSGEDAYLRRCAEIFGVSGAEFARLRAIHDPEADDPWAALSLSPGASADEVSARRKALVREAHPDRLIARGLPPEAVRLAEARLARINAAYEALMARGASSQN